VKNNCCKGDPPFSTAVRIGVSCVQNCKISLTLNRFCNYVSFFFLDISLTGCALQINISNIPEEGLSVRFSKNGEWFQRSLPTGDDCGLHVQKIDVQCLVEKILKNVSIKGRIEAGGELDCCRCLERFDFPVEIEFKYVLTPAEDLEEDDLELTYEDLEYGHYKGDIIDLNQLLVEQIILQVPIKPLCDDSCRGLCPTCGRNLNREKCDHKAQQVSGSFAALKNFKVKKER
jgi:uncharacterized protein